MVTGCALPLEALRTARAATRRMDGKKKESLSVSVSELRKSKRGYRRRVIGHRVVSHTLNDGAMETAAQTARDRALQRGAAA